MSKQNRLKAITGSRFFWMAVSLLASVTLWLYVTSTEGVSIERTYKDVKVEFIGEEELRESGGLVITEQDHASVDLTLSGLRRDLGKITAGSLSVTVDLTDIKSTGHFTKLYEIKYPDGVKEDDISLVSTSPRSIALTVDLLTSKTVEVKGSFTGSTAEGYMARDTMTFDPMAVKISGPKAAIDLVDHALVTITREGVDATLSYATSYTLVDANGETVDAGEITRDVEEVNVTLTVLMTKTVSLTAALIPGGGAVEENAVVSVEPASIVLAGTAEALASVNQIVVDTVKLGNVNSLYEAAGLLITIPNDTMNLSGITTASVRVEIQNLATGTQTVARSGIVCTNVPEGYTAEIITESLPVLLRSNEEDLASITTANIRVVADLTEIGANAGIFNVPVKISVDGHPEAGAVGEYKVYVSISPAR